MKFIRKHPVSIPIVVIVLSISVFTCRFSFADSDKRPERGSIMFGTTEKKSVDVPAQFAPFKTIFADVAAKVIPAVVSVKITKIDTIVFAQNPFYQMFNDPFLGDPFGDFFYQQPQQPNRRNPHQRQQQPQQKFQTQKSYGLGSGVIVSKEGYILTNAHVVMGADEIQIRLSDGKEFDASIIGIDSLQDVAVIKIKKKVEDLAVVQLGNSDNLRPGDWAMAIGNPFREELASTVTVGIVSALHRNLNARDLPGQKQYQNFIQTDAAINPGNSGGALVNIDGELIGINTMILSGSGGNVGIGMAIPVNAARRVMEDLIYDGKVSRGYLGIQIQDLTPAMRQALKIGEQQGVMVGGVVPKEAGDKGGMKAGDVVLSIDSKDVNSVEMLRGLVASIRPGTKVPIVVLRKNEKVTLQVTIGELNEKKLAQKTTGNDQNDNAQKNNDVAEKIGLKVGDITSELRNQLNLDNSATGVVVLNVDENSVAAEQGLRQNDIIHQINQIPVATVADFKKIMKNIKKGDAVLFFIERDGNTYFVAFKVEK